MREKLHQYDLTTELAKKHSHSTYLASPTSEPEHQVVLTVFAASLFHFSHERENLLRKAQYIKQLQHPHLLPILDMGIEEEQPFVVREYLPNGSLRSRLKKIFPHRLELRDALTIVVQVGEALTYAYEHNILHGNIKPENILLDANGQTVLTDFYLVSRKDAIIRDQTSGEYAFCYLAPEQFAGVTDARSDQYALGCLAYELITGRIPFAAHSLASMMGRRNNLQPAPFSDSVADLSPSLEAAVLKALAEDPEERFYDFSLFLEVIQSVLSPPPAFPLARSTHSRKNRTISRPEESAKAEDHLFPIRERATKRVAPQTFEPSEASLRAESSIAEPAIASSMPDASMLREVASTPGPQLLELDAGVELFAPLDSSRTSSKTTDERANRPLQVKEKDAPSPAIFEAISQLDIFPSESGADAHLTQKKFDDLWLSKSLAEEGTEVPSLGALVTSIDGQDDFGTPKITQLQTSVVDIPRSRRVGLSYRKKVLGLGLVLSITIALLTYVFWPSGMTQPDTSSQSAQEIVTVPIPLIPIQHDNTPISQPPARSANDPKTQGVASANDAYAVSVGPADPVALITSVDGSVTGSGLNQFNYVGHWVINDNAPCDLYKCSATYDSTANDYATFTFTGRQIQYFAVKDIDQGIVAVSLDGGPETQLDLYSPVRQADVAVWNSPVLNQGNHTFKIRVTGNKNPSSQNSIVVVDRCKFGK